MAKPFVVITPEAEREALRNSGVLPESFFRVFDISSSGLRKDWDDERPSLYFWPHNLRYSGEPDRTADGVYKPDVPSFFGLKTPVNDAEKRHNERLITGLLSSVMVHVVFLDSRRGQNGYAAFKSFADIVKWGRSLRRALNVRFRNEDTLQSMENVLVIVARGEQVTLRNSDIRDFDDCVQRWRGDIFSSERDDDGEPLRKIFQSCYFMDYNLCVRDSRELYHAAEVWDVVVGRLLLSFLLARNGRMRWWQIPGVKLWRSLGCLADIDAESNRKVVDEALASANAKLQNYAASSEDLDELALLHRDPERVEPIKGVLLEPDDVGHAGWRHEPSGGWSDFGASVCAEKSSETTTGPRWKPAFDRIAKSFRDWRVKCSRVGDADDAGAVFNAVHRSPGNLLKATEGVYSKLSGDAVDSEHKPEEGWKAIVRAELLRRQAVERIKLDAPELEKAQRHYVGLGMSVVAVASVCSALGLASYYVTHTVLDGFGYRLVRQTFSVDPVSGAKTLINSTPLASLPLDWLVALVLFGLFAIGSVLAAALMLGCHLRAGRRAVAKMRSESEAIDALMVDRDRKARELVGQGIWMRDRLHLQGVRFRTWSLLKRTQDILVTELQPTLSKLSDVPSADGSSPEVESERHDVRGTFLARTDRRFGPYRITLKEDVWRALEREVSNWWSAQTTFNSVPVSDARNFFELWHGLCSDDLELAGYFPARTFTAGIRNFVARFSDAIRLVAKLNVLKDHKAELRSGVLRWFENLQSTEYYLYATGAVTGEHVNEDMLENARVYLADNDAVDVDSINASHRGSQADQSRFMPEISAELNLTRHLALLFQEIKIQFCCDAEGDEYGHLTFKEVADIPGGGNG